MREHFNFIFVFSPALPNPITGGKVETEPIRLDFSGHPKSPKPMEPCQQVGKIHVQTSNEISESQTLILPPV